jgi:hypothetical protein
MVSNRREMRRALQNRTGKMQRCRTDTVGQGQPTAGVEERYSRDLTPVRAVRPEHHGENRAEWHAACISGRR